MRCHNKGVKDHTDEVISHFKEIACPCSEVCCVVLVAGSSMQMCESCKSTLMSMCATKSACAPHCLTLVRTSSNVCTISFCTGLVMRCCDFLKRWVDTTSEAPAPNTHKSLTSPAVRLIPFLNYVSPARAGLLSECVDQAVCNPSCKYDSTRTLVPLHCEAPLMTLEEAADAESKWCKSLPGLNLFVIFMNTDLTYEDGIVMSASASMRFKHPCIKHVKFAVATKIPDAGSITQPFSVSWWQVAFEGTVTCSSLNSVGTTALSMRFVGFPVNGDKFAALHGQKGAVTMLPDNQMPRAKNITAELMMGSSAATKRQTASQIIEAACGLCCKSEGADSCTVSPTRISRFASKNSKSTDKTNVHSVCEHAEGEVLVPNDDGMHSKVNRNVWTIGSSATTVDSARVNCGVVRVMQSAFMASTKMSCAQRTAKSHNMSAVSGSSAGGSKSLGEMELVQLEASGFRACMEEFMQRSEACVVEVCRNCSCILMLRGCNNEQKSAHGTCDAILSSSSVRAMTGIRVTAGLNTKLGAKLN